MPEPLQVTAAEAGQKLLQFLSRRFEEPQSVLHRWIRSTNRYTNSLGVELL